MQSRIVACREPIERAQNRQPSERGGIAKECHGEHQKIRCKGNKVKLIKQTLYCAMCHEESCPSICIIQEKRKRNKESEEIINDPDFKNILDVNTWPETKMNNQSVKIKPSLNADIMNGNKYTIIGIFNSDTRSTLLDMQIDTGSYITVMGSDLASEIGLQVYTGQTRTARTASGMLDIQYEARGKVDLGIVSINMTIAVTCSPKWPRNLFLMGTDTLESLETVIDLKNEILYLHKKYPVKMFTNQISKRKYMEEMKAKYISFQSINIHAHRNTTIRPFSSKTMKITVNKWESIAMQGTHIYFSARDIQEHVEVHDLWYDANYDWSKNKFKVTLTNHSDKPRHIWSRDFLGTLKTIIPENLQHGCPILRDMKAVESRSADETDEGIHLMMQVPEEEEMKYTVSNQPIDPEGIFTIWEQQQNKDDNEETKRILQKAADVIEQMEKEMHK